MPPEAFHELQVETRGEFGGIGIEITIRDGKLTVVSPIDGTPAYRLGVKAEDHIVRIEDFNTKGITLREAVRRMKEQAIAGGYDAVVNVRLETSRMASAFGNGQGTAGIEILAFGTAIRHVQGSAAT